jgi:hypothetical protein
MDSNRPHAGAPGSAEKHQKDDGCEHGMKRNRPRAADPDIQRHPGDYMAGAEGTQHIAPPEPEGDEDKA